MSDSMTNLLQRRAELQARIAAQRGEMAGIAARLHSPLAIADRGIAALRFLNTGPFMAAGIVVMLVARRHGAAALLGSGLRLWTGYRALSAIWSRLTARG